MTQITATRALKELKTLDKRIKDKISSFAPVSLRKNNEKNTIHGVSVEDFREKAKSDLQSINDLIAQRYKIKAALVTSNATTEITVADKKYTVAAAIERKQNIEYEKSLASMLERHSQQAFAQFEQNNVALEYQIQQTINQFVSSDKKKVEDIKVLIDTLKNDRELVMEDPVNAKSLALKMREEIEAFETNVDIALSEINATSLIEV